MTFSVKSTIKVGDDSLETINTLGAKKIFFITDPFVVESRMIDQVINLLDKSVNYTIFSEIRPDPDQELVDNGKSVLKNFNPDLVIAIGGGSAIDATKAIIYNIYKERGEKIPFIAIPTTAGTGSEATNFAVVTVGDSKKVLIDDLMLPDYALLVAKFTKTVPNFITADTGMDVLTHALEAYISKNASIYTDTFAETCIKTVFEILPKVYDDGDRLSLRERMLEVSNIAGIAFNNAGLGINHSLAHTIGGNFHISHGRLNAILLPYVLDYNCKNDERARKKLDSLAKKLGHNDYTCIIKEIEKLNKKFKIPEKLSGLGKIDARNYANAIDKMADTALNDRCTPTNPALVTKFDLANILRDSF
ncbi:iron-containing alcohol dehydrogenase [Anaerococcus sp. AGMB00486]|uniref:Iron-containing alcohol dehydrogenase n=1 Tax=Anaerococcus faecalis TaxID=2742993 RepID=A0ABX2N9Y9_9FIRM|nr:1-propanol dehydrogenase PduQ [Anaerococcus faecalis]NVF11527.1 iron-containing alcohol dehydrogenase [Anaerococcus faecalis]